MIPVGVPLSCVIAVVEGQRARSDKQVRINQRQVIAQWAQASSMIASELLAGASPLVAVRHVADEMDGADDMEGQVARELRAMVNHCAWLGAPCAPLSTWSCEPDQVGRQAIARAWLVSHRTGVPLAEVMQATAADLQAKLHHQERTEASLAGPRASTRVLMFLPLVGVAMGQSMGAGSIQFLLPTQLGGLLLLVGVVLEVMGLEWSRALMAKAVAV